MTPQKRPYKAWEDLTACVRVGMGGAMGTWLAGLYPPWMGFIAMFALQACVQVVVRALVEWWEL